MILTKEGVGIGEMLGRTEREITETVVADGVIATVFGNTDVGWINDWLLDISTTDVKVSEMKYVDSDWGNEEGLADPTAVDIAASRNDIVECNNNDDVIKVYWLPSDVMLSTSTEVDNDGEGETVSAIDIIVSVDGKEVIDNSTVDATTSEYIIVSSDILKVSSDDAGIAITSIVDAILSNDIEVGSMNDKRESDTATVDVILFNIVESSNNDEEVGISIENTGAENDIEELLGTSVDMTLSMWVADVTIPNTSEVDAEAEDEILVIDVIGSKTIVDIIVSNTAEVVGSEIVTDIISSVFREVGIDANGVGDTSIVEYIES